MYLLVKRCGNRRYSPVKVGIDTEWGRKGLRNLRLSAVAGDRFGSQPQGMELKAGVERSRSSSWGWGFSRAAIFMPQECFAAPVAGFFSAETFRLLR